MDGFVIIILKANSVQLDLPTGTELGNDNFEERPANLILTYGYCGKLTIRCGDIT